MTPKAPTRTVEQDAPLAEVRTGMMTAAVLHGREDVRIERVPVPQIREDEVLVRVGVALTDGTDLKVWKQGFHARMIRPPALFGHELAGTVAAVGSAVDAKVQVGQRVVPANSARAMPVSSVARASRTFARTFCSTMARTRNTFAFRGRIVAENMLQIQTFLVRRRRSREPLACVLRGIHETIMPATLMAVAVIGCSTSV